MSETKRSALAFVRVSSAGNASISEVRRSPAYIGTDAACDVALQADGKNTIDPRHAQLLALPDGRFRLVNLSKQPIAMPDQTPAVLSARDKMDLDSGSHIVIGPYALQIMASMETADDTSPAGPRRRESDSIGLKLAPQGTTSLAEGQILPIAVTIKNNGKAERVKFEVAVIGVDAAFREVNDGPVLAPGEEGEILVKISQPAELEASKLPAGDLNVGVRVTAAPYAGQPAEEIVTIHVLPIYQLDIEEAAG